MPLQSAASQQTWTRRQLPRPSKTAGGPLFKLSRRTMAMSRHIRCERRIDFNMERRWSRGIRAMHSTLKSLIARSGIALRPLPLPRCLLLLRLLRLGLLLRSVSRCRLIGALLLNGSRFYVVAAGVRGRRWSRFGVWNVSVIAVAIAVTASAASALRTSVARRTAPIALAIGNRRIVVVTAGATTATTRGEAREAQQGGNDECKSHGRCPEKEV